MQTLRGARNPTDCGAAADVARRFCRLVAEINALLMAHRQHYP